MRKEALGFAACYRRDARMRKEITQEADTQDSSAADALPLE